MDDAKGGPHPQGRRAGRRAVCHAGRRPRPFYSLTSPGDLAGWCRTCRYVQVSGKAREEPSLLMSIFVSWFPMLLLIGVWIFFMRQMQGGEARRRVQLRQVARACSTRTPIR